MKRKVQALSIRKNENQRFIDILIDPLYPLSLKRVRGVGMKKGMTLRLMIISVYILKSTRHILMHSRRSCFSNNSSRSKKKGDPITAVEERGIIDSIFLHLMDLPKEILRLGGES